MENVNFIFFFFFFEQLHPTICLWSFSTAKKQWWGPSLSVVLKTQPFIRCVFCLFNCEKWLNINCFHTCGMSHQSFCSYICISKDRWSCCPWCWTYTVSRLLSSGVAKREPNLFFCQTKLIKKNNKNTNLDVCSV